VVDDGSADNTKKIIQRTKNKKISYLYQRNQGPAAARNQGIKHAKGEFICFLDSDDRFCREKLQISYDYVKKYPDYKIFHTEEIWYRNGKLLPQKKYHKKPDGFVFPHSLRLCCIGISTSTIKKEVISEIGLFDEKFPACEDYDFWLRTAARYPVFLIPQYLTIKEGGRPDQQSKKYPAMDVFRIHSLDKILSSGILNEKYYNLAYQELKNKCEIYIKGAKKRAKFKEVSQYKDLLLKYNNKNLWKKN